MIIHSVEYYQALKREMEQLSSIINAKPYSSDIPFVVHGIDQEIRVCDYALDHINCNSCFNNIKPEGRCSVNGVFPDGLNTNTYNCPNWIFEDVPF